MTISMMMMVVMMVKLMGQKGFEETEGSSEVTGPVQQGEVRGGVFQSVFSFFLNFFFRCCFLLSSLSRF